MVPRTSGLTALLASLILACGCTPSGTSGPSSSGTSTASTAPAVAARTGTPDKSKSLEEITNSIGQTLVLIPAGEFVMGAPSTDKAAEGEGGQSSERPQHPVKITKPFYLGKYEVTQGEWVQVMNTKPWQGKENTIEGPDYPATFVSWEDAVAFCKKLSDKEGKSYRLPTEAEWEYACRGGTTTRFSFGDEPTNLAEYSWSAAYDNGSAKDETYAHAVGTKKANPFNLHDMYGNVWEWCSDWFDPKYYGKSPKEDPTGPEKGVARVNRSGSWLLRPEVIRSSFRYAYEPGNKTPLHGFRVALDKSSSTATAPSKDAPPKKATGTSGS